MGEKRNNARNPNYCFHPIHNSPSPKRAFPFGGRSGWGLFLLLHRIPHLFQNSFLIALDQLIEQPQHGLDHPRMWRNLAGGTKGLNRIVRRGDPLGRPYDGNPTQRQPLRIQRGIILGRLGKDFIRLRNGLGKSLLRGFPFPLPQGDDSELGGDIVIVF